jgi:hypothetical protein
LVLATRLGFEPRYELPGLWFNAAEVQGPPEVSREDHDQL